MANEKNIRRVSRLTGALLARKGAAAPSPASALLNQQAINRFPTFSQEKTVPQEMAAFQGRMENSDYALKSPALNPHIKSPALNPHIKSPALNPHIIVNEKDSEPSVAMGHITAKEQKVSIKKSKSIKSPHEASAKKRIAMTLRMEKDIHLHLRIFSAYTRKSCQAILSEALELYLAENSDKILSQRMAFQK